MRETGVARRYARAFAELYSDADSLEEISAGLKAFAGVFHDSRPLRTVMMNPAVTHDDKKSVLDAILKKMDMGAHAVELLEYLLEKDRLNLVSYVAGEFERISFDLLGKVRVEVTTSTIIPESAKRELTDKLSAFSGKRAIVDLKTDPSLIGGVVARIGSVVYDGSIKNQLIALRAGLE